MSASRLIADSTAAATTWFSNDRGVAAPTIRFTDPEVPDHVLAQGAPLVGSYRVLAHMSLALRALRCEKNARRPLSLSAICLAGDVAYAALLARSKREWFGARLLYDCADAALWAATAGGDPIITEGANLFAVGGSVEASYRAGRHAGPLRLSDLRCLIPTVVTCEVTACVRRHKGGQPGYGFAAWGLIGVVAGFALGRNQRAAERRLVESWREHAGPKVEAAWWLGQHDLATDERSERSPHHLTKELLILERDYGSVRALDARSMLEARKREVRVLTRQFGDYLGRVVIGRTVEPEGAWSVRLTPEQVGMLEGLLPAPSGHPEVVVVLDEEEARRPGGEVSLRCGDLQFILPAAAAPERWRGDAAAVGFIFGAISKLYPGTPATGGASLPAVAIPALIDLMGAFSYRRDGPDPDPRSAHASVQAGAPVRAALATGLLSAALAGATARTPAKEGVQIYPGGEGLWGHHIILARYWAHLTWRQRAWALVGSFSIAGTAATLRWAKTGERVHWPSATEAILAAIVPFSAALGLGDRLLTQTAAGSEAMACGSVVAMDAARSEGMKAEARRLLRWMDQVDDALATLPRDREDETIARLRFRFGEVREWLVSQS